MTPPALRLTASALLVVAGVLPPAADASESARASVVISAQFSSRTSLEVSTRLLQFDVGGPSDVATASVDFSAGVRTRAGAQVMLSVEPVDGVQGPGGAGEVESLVTFVGEGDGTVAGALDGTPAIACRWTGSGRRTGRLVFSLRAGASGSYMLPVRFVLSAP